MSASVLLKVENLRVGYGHTTVLHDVSLTLEERKALAILGPNGAGKSTLGHALSGLLTPSAGRIELNGQDITGKPPHVFRRLGLTYVPEGRGIFRSLSVADNLEMAAMVASSRNERQQAIESAFEMFPALAPRRSQGAGTLSGGEQQMLSMARALLVKSKILVVDEVSLGLAPKIVDLMFAALAAARDRGVSIIIIEQFVSRALNFADNCMLLEHGSVGWSGDTSDAELRLPERYLGMISS